MTDAFVARNDETLYRVIRSASDWLKRGFQGRANDAGRMSGAVAAVVAAGAVATVMTGVLAGPAAAQGVVRQSFGDWQQRCEKPTGASTEQCALVQNVAASDRPNMTLLVIVLNTADGKGRLLRVLAPLGVLLPAGLGLKIDQADVGRAGFVRCLPTGCVAEVVMDENLVNRLKAGKIGTFVVFQTPEEGIGVPINLAGLDKGLEALK